MSPSRSPRAHASVVIGLVLAFSLVVAACSWSVGGPSNGSAERRDPDATTSTTQQPDERTPVDPGTLEWGTCEDSGALECATLSVPLDWDEPDGATIDLAVARLPASGDREGAILTNPGGPGGSGIDFLVNQPFDAELTSRFDIVSWDPRGVARSGGLKCGAAVTTFLAADPDPDTEPEQAAIERAAEAVADECEDLDGDVLPHLGTDSVARDLEALRVALGDDPLNYVGFSYGTFIGERYLRPVRLQRPGDGARRSGGPDPGPDRLARRPDRGDGCDRGTGVRIV